MNSIKLILLLACTLSFAPPAFAARMRVNLCAQHLGAEKIEFQLRSQINDHPLKLHVAIVFSVPKRENSKAWIALVKKMKQLADAGEIGEFETYDLFGGFSLRADSETILALAADDSVGSISGDLDFELIR